MAQINENPPATITLPVHICSQALIRSGRGHLPESAGWLPTIDMSPSSCHEPPSAPLGRLKVMQQHQLWITMVKSVWQSACLICFKCGAFCQNRVWLMAPLSVWRKSGCAPKVKSASITPVLKIFLTWLTNVLKLNVIFWWAKLCWVDVKIPQL